MNLQKERDAFEAWHYEQYLLENPNIDITNAKYIYDYTHKNALVFNLKESHFITWQAAKVQANKNFEDFIDQSIEDSACADERQSLKSLLDEFQDIAMIEAQEQVNP